MAKRPKVSNQLPALPGGVLVGVLKDFVEVYTPTTECPSPFLWSSFATVLGNAVSPYVARDNALRTEPRLYTANIGQSGVSRRSTGARRATDVIKIALGQTGIQMVNGFGSMEGLLRVLQNANGVPVLNYFDELELMFKKAGVPGSAGTTPLHVLYEETSYSHTLRQRGTMNLVNAHLALLGNSTTERFTDIWQGEHLDSGFFSRWMLVTAGLARRIPDPKPVVRKNLINLSLAGTRPLTPRFFRGGTRGEDLREPRLPKRDDVPESDAV